MKFAAWILSPVLALGLALPIAAFAAPADEPLLTPEQRESVRRNFENLFNEMDLMVRNERTDKNDLDRAQRELASREVRDAIPSEDDLPRLQSELAALAKSKGVELVSLKLAGRDKPSKPLPKEVFTDQGFRLDEDHVLETIFAQALVKSPNEKAVADWIDSWATKSGRAVEADLATGFGARAIKALGGDRFLVNARTFKFRKIRYPRLKPRAPEALLPTHARNKLSVFRKQEPQLAKLMDGIRKLRPKSERYYREREKFLLATAQLNAAIKKTKARGEAPPHAHPHPQGHPHGQGS